MAELKECPECRNLVHVVGRKVQRLAGHYRGPVGRRIHCPSSGWTLDYIREISAKASA